MSAPDKPYNDLPKLPPKSEIETRAVLKKWGLARAALTELRVAGQTIPDPTALNNTIPLLEAKDSSEIENIVTTNDRLFREAALETNDGDPATKESLRYRRALYDALDAMKARPLSSQTAIEICKTITGLDLDVRTTPVTLSNRQTGEIVYTPPQGVAVLQALLSNWDNYLHADDDIDPLIRMAVLHYQFEAIHPFVDGNGRTGRILNVIYLMSAGLLDAPTLYLSRHILKTRSEYYAALADVTKNADWQQWLLYILTAVEITCLWTTGKITAIRNLQIETSAYMRTQRPKIYSHELVDLIFAQPYCRIANLVERGIAKRQAASTYLQELVAIGILIEEKHGRDKVFVHRKYMDLLGSDGHEFAPYPLAPAAGATASATPERKKAQRTNP